MVQHKRNYPGNTGVHPDYNDYKEMEMKKPVELWQAILGTLATLGVIVGFFFNITTQYSNQLTAHESRINALEREREENRRQFQNISDKLTEILIAVENKQDRK